MSYRVFRFFLFVCICLTLSSSLYAQVGIDSEQEIESVEVSTTSSLPVTKESAPKQIISSEKIQALGFESLHQAVSTFSGVNITDYGGVGGVKTVSVRSLGAHHTAVSYDGVVVSNAQGGQVDIGSFALDDVESVSLTIGQGDEIFQTARSFESSGVLHLKSAAPTFTTSNIKVSARADIGSFGYLSPNLSLAARVSDRWSIKVSGEYLHSDGDYPFTLVNNSLVTEEIRLNSAVSTSSSEINIYGDVGKSGGKVHIKGSYLDSERELPGGVIYYNTEADEMLWDTSYFIQGGYSTPLGDKWALQSYAKYNYAWNRYGDWSNSYQNGYLEYNYTQREYYASGALRFAPNERWSFSYALDLAENTLDSDLQYCPDPLRLSILNALASQYKGERLTVTASLLGVYNHEWALQETYTIAPDRDHLSPAVSASYKILRDKELRVRASIKDAYRVPTFNDLYYSSLGNTSLVPEKAMQYNIGVTYGGAFLPSIFDYLNLTIDSYYNKITDKIVAIPTMFIWRMMNLGEVEILGSDVNASLYLTLAEGVKLNLSGNYTYQRAIDVTDPDDKNYRDQIPYTPLHSGNISSTLSTQWFDLGYAASIIGDRYCLPQNIESNLIEGYSDHSVTLSRIFEFDRFSMRVAGSVLNIFDVNYDVIKYYPMPGRQYRLSLKFNY